jgi:hypothetical protein
VNLSPFLPVCIDVAPFILAGGAPSGGVYTGPGVSGGSFYPSVAGTGTHNITYSYTDLNSCTNSASTSIAVNNLPSVSISGLNASYCLNSSPVTVSGNPPGGNFSGPGMAANIFSPSTAGAGLHDIVYMYADPNNCMNSDTVTVLVDPCTGLAEIETDDAVTVYPNPAKDKITLIWDNIDRFDVIIIYSKLGQKLIEIPAGENSANIDLSQLTPGIYFIRLHGRDLARLKVIKE